MKRFVSKLGCSISIREPRLEWADRTDRLLCLRMDNEGGDGRYAEVMLSREDMQQLVEMATLAYIETGDPLVTEAP